MKWSVPREWDGETVAILGGGPGLTLEQVRHARQFRRIATNNAFLLDPEADVLCWNDDRWWLANAERIGQFRGPYKVTWAQRHNRAQRIQYSRDGVLQLERENMRPFSTDPRKIAGSNAGHGAVNLAYHFGAARILLLGFDMTTLRGFNWHEDHKRHATEKRFREFFIPQMEQAAVQLKAAGVEVINCTLQSELKCFPMARIEEFAQVEQLV